MPGCSRGRRLAGSDKLAGCGIRSAGCFDCAAHAPGICGVCEAGNGRPVGLADFQKVQVVGKGSYGKVMLVLHLPSGEYFAMKALNKDHIKVRNQVEHTRTERRTLEKVKHPFIVDLRYAFQTPKRLYFVMEFCTGGELFFHLSRVDRFSKDHARFYAGELTLALGYIHALQIIYRDLKPENVLICGDGHLKLTDFGLSKEGVSDNVSAKSQCGTPEYLAPEILNNSGHGRAVDWYSLGALVFELMTGLPPFYNDDRQRIFEGIRAGVLEYPEYVDETSRDFMAKLLLRDPDQRLGGGQADVEEVKTHEFFNWTSQNWSQLLRKQIAPPFVPAAARAGETPYVEDEFAAIPVADSERAGVSVGAGLTFQGFSYNGDNCDEEGAPLAPILGR